MDYKDARIEALEKENQRLLDFIKDLQADVQKFINEITVVL